MWLNVVECWYLFVHDLTHSGLWWYARLFPWVSPMAIHVETLRVSAAKIVKRLNVNRLTLIYQDLWFSPALLKNLLFCHKFWRPAEWLTVQPKILPPCYWILHPCRAGKWFPPAGRDWPVAGREIIPTRNYFHNYCLIFWKDDYHKISCWTWNILSKNVCCLIIIS